MSGATADLAAIWFNPTGVIVLAMLLGGDIVHNALAQSSGVSFAPACFSFGWVTYAFSALRSVFSCDGRLLPPPDIPGLRVYNLTTGTSRANRNWAVARLMSTLESRIARETPMFRDGIRITVFKPAQPPTIGPESEPDHGHRRRREQLLRRKASIINLGAILMQLGIAFASVPWEGSGSWIILIVTISGIIIGTCFSSLPQWAAEKVPERRHSTACFALTRGRGFKDIVVICCAKDGDTTNGGTGWLNLEKLAAAEPPRTQWRQWPKKTKKASPATVAMGGGGGIIPSLWTKSYTALGVPLQLWITRAAAFGHAILWLAILVTISGLTTDQWFLLGIGALGLAANLVIMSLETLPDDGVPELRLEDSIATARDMDGIMDFETTYACGRPLLSEFICRPMTKDEERWWSGDSNGKEAFTAQRMAEHRTRGYPRSPSNPSSKVKEKENKMVSSGIITSVRDLEAGPSSPVETVADGGDGVIHVVKVRSAESARFHDEIDIGSL